MLVLDQVKKGDLRLRCLAAGILLGLAILVCGLWYIQVVSRHKYESSLRIQSFRTVRTPAARGRILDRNGAVLADNQPRYNVNLYLEDIREQFKFEYTNNVRKEFVHRYHRRPKKKEYGELEELARYIVVSNIVWKVSEAVLPQPLVLNPYAFAKHYREQLAMPMPIVTDLTPQQIALFMEKAVDLPGIELEVEPYRYYPNGPIAAHVLGYVQQEMQPESEEDIHFRYRLPDYTGKSGIESGFDEELRGKAGAKAILVNNIGYRQSEETWLAPDPGKNVVLTLDLQIQKAAENALARSGRDTRGAAVVMDVRTGDVLAMASAPDYDPNIFVRPSDYSSNDWARLNDEVLAPQYNRALQGAYNPGSIFKIIVALACFENKTMSPTEVIYNPGVFTLGRRKIKDTAPPGEYDFKEAFKHSCNYYFINFGLEVGAEKVVEMGDRFDLGEKTGVVQPSLEQRGYFPKADQMLKQDGSRWMDGDTANLCIGQGEVLVTPMQMALMTAAVANGGKLLKPRLVMELEDQETKIATEALPPGQTDHDLHVDPHNLQLVREAMRADVEEEGGTGKEAYIPGMGICGKTGTAQIRVHGHLDHVTWFVSFAPFDNPRYAVVVVVESGSSGGGTCAPKAKEIYQAIQKKELDRLKKMAGPIQ
jgi:penicillin-binding protein 2